MLDSTFLYEQAHEADPLDFAPIAAAMRTLVEKGREDLLAPWLERAMAVDTKRWETLYFHAVYFELRGEYGATIELYEKMLIVYPEVDPHGLGLARCGLATRRFDNTLAVCRHALDVLQTDAPFDSPVYAKHVYIHQFHLLMSEILLCQGDLRGFAYQLAQTQVRCPSYHLSQVSVWNNEALTGKHLLITAAAGYGDQVLYGSLISKLAELDCRITLTIHPDLAPIFAHALPNVQCIALPMPTALLQEPPAELAQYLADDLPDYQANLWQLPMMCALLRQHEPLAFTPYLEVPEQATEAANAAITAVRTQAGGRRIVGIAWDRLQQMHPELFGAVEAARTERSSLPADLLGTLVDDAAVAEHVHFVALHERSASNRLPLSVPDNLSLIDIEPGDFMFTAALMQACDLVLSVDMSVANLAAMLGLPTWLMMSYEGDWRWGVNGQSPWIPGPRMFRPAKPGAWTSVLNAVKRALEAEISSNSAQPMQTVRADIATETLATSQAATK